MKPSCRTLVEILTEGDAWVLVAIGVMVLMALIGAPGVIADRRPETRPWCLATAAIVLGRSTPRSNGDTQWPASRHFDTAGREQRSASHERRPAMADMRSASHEKLPAIANLRPARPEEYPAKPQQRTEMSDRSRETAEMPMAGPQLESAMGERRCVAPDQEPATHEVPLGVRDMPLAGYQALLAECDTPLVACRMPLATTRWESAVCEEDPAGTDSELAMHR